MAESLESVGLSMCTSLSEVHHCLPVTYLMLTVWGGGGLCVHGPGHYLRSCGSGSRSLSCDLSEGSLGRLGSAL